MAIAGQIMQPEKPETRGRKIMKQHKFPKSDEQEIRELIERWAKAVRDVDYDGILAHHSPDMLMFDLPPPLAFKDLKAYRKTWDLFFSMQPRPIAFEIQRMEVTAGAEVAFATALMQCEGEGLAKFDFRLTVGLRKVEGLWVILHEHHSVPAT
jgi:ketosteroid isomerase-like protein